MTRRSVVVIVVLLMLAAITGVLSLKGVQRINRDQRGKIFRKHLPNINLELLDGTISSLSKVEYDQRLIVIHFNSTCEHCYYEAIDIVKHINDFSSSSIVMVSSESMVKIKKFSTQTGLDACSKVILTRAESLDIYDNFGPLSTPHALIYGADGDLAQEFKGEIKAQLLARNF